ncbi:MAG: phosphoglycerate dehydrogenase, partial [Negativicutes bacterium]|nr:phosphoglycerate dehydrogenase [Negativicutes bacterium]
MRVLVSDPVSERGVEMLKKHFAVDVKTKLPPEELISIIGEYDALVVRSETKVTKAVLEAAVNLKVIGRAGVGVDNIDVEAATQRGIIVLNAPEGNTIAATEHTIAMMLSLARNIPQAHASMKQKEWQRSKFMGVEMRGKTLGIFGLGRIGTGVAKRAIALEMNIMGYDPFISAAQAEQLGIKMAEIDEILAEADFLTFHLPLTAETKNMINKDSFAKMKKGVRIINCARGGVINEADLAEALKSGVVAGAAIDVFEKEPVSPDNPLLECDNIVLTPHLGASTAEAQVGVAVDVAEGIIAALTGNPVLTAVNMAPIPKHVLEVIKPYMNLAEKMGCLAVHLADGR